MEKLTKLREAAEAATPGPWGQQRNSYRHNVKCSASDGYPVGYVVAKGFGASQEATANARHIANMDPKTTLTLLDGWRVMQEALENHCEVRARLSRDGSWDKEKEVKMLRAADSTLHDALARVRAIAEGIELT